MLNGSESTNTRHASALQRGATALALLLTLACVRPTLAADDAPVGARAGLEIATAAAQSWASDAVLVYLENDETLTPGGAAPRWGYLFYSASGQRARGYSVREGRLVTASNLDMKFEAPPVAAGWIDSDAAIAAAANEAGKVFKQQPGCLLSSMLLMRGAFDEEHPDRTTWTLVYTAPNQPSLFVVVDAAAAKVRRTWRG